MAKRAKINYRSLYGVQLILYMAYILQSTPSPNMSAGAKDHHARPYYIPLVRILYALCTCTVCTRRVHIYGYMDILYKYLAIQEYLHVTPPLGQHGEPFIFSHPSSAAWVSCLLLALPFPTLCLQMISFAFKEHCHRFGHETLRPP